VDHPADVEEFLSALPDDQRRALEHLADVIRNAAPDATEGLGYGAPAFRYTGRSLVSYGAGKDHCSFYVQSPALMEAHADLVAALDTSKGTIRFSADSPLPDELVTTLVRARMAETDSKS
jgi:uncharacterized protein YdhG (YjbR/CyaY superfamily)